MNLDVVSEPSLKMLTRACELRLGRRNEFPTGGVIHQNGARSFFFFETPRVSVYDSLTCTRAHTLETRHRKVALRRLSHVRSVTEGSRSVKLKSTTFNGAISILRRLFPSPPLSFLSPPPSPGNSRDNGLTVVSLEKIA